MSETNVPALVVVRRLNAQPERVFAAFTEPELLVRWLGPRGSRLTACDVDPRPGGRFRFQLGFDDGEIALVGVYRNVEPVSRLVFTWGLEGEADDSEVTVLLAPTAGGTQLRLEHRGLAPDEIAQNEAGWGEFFDRLETALLNGSAETQLGG